MGWERGWTGEGEGELFSSALTSLFGFKLSRFVQVVEANLLKIKPLPLFTMTFLFKLPNPPLKFKHFLCFMALFFCPLPLTDLFSKNLNLNLKQARLLVLIIELFLFLVFIFLFITLLFSVPFILSIINS
jgi:hypothetical protein